ncbi:hypothetical protein NECID01_0567 [Nematocida sp. AWRm77]|nr:hypothetical protein NECID01_0567 [Nematocida sp. AWRm77]
MAYSSILNAGRLFAFCLFFGAFSTAQPEKDYMLVHKCIQTTLHINIRLPDNINCKKYLQDELDSIFADKNTIQDAEEVAVIMTGLDPELCRDSTFLHGFNNQLAYCIMQCISKHTLDCGMVLRTLVLEYFWLSHKQPQDKSTILEYTEKENEDSIYDSYTPNIKVRALSMCNIPSLFPFLPFLRKLEIYPNGSLQFSCIKKLSFTDLGPLMAWNNLNMIKCTEIQYLYIKRYCISYPLYAPLSSALMQECCLQLDIGISTNKFCLKLVRHIIVTTASLKNITHFHRMCLKYRTSAPLLNLMDLTNVNYIRINASSGCMPGQKTDANDVCETLECAAKFLSLLDNKILPLNLSIYFNHLDMDPADFQIQDCYTKPVFFKNRLTMYKGLKVYNSTNVFGDVRSLRPWRVFDCYFSPKSQGSLFPICFHVSIPIAYLPDLIQPNTLTELSVFYPMHEFVKFLHLYSKSCPQAWTCILCKNILTNGSAVGSEPLSKSIVVMPNGAVSHHSCFDSSIKTRILPKYHARNPNALLYMHRSCISSSSQEPAYKYLFSALSNPNAIDYSMMPAQYGNDRILIVVSKYQQSNDCFETNRQD